MPQPESQQEAPNGDGHLLRAFFEKVSKAPCRVLLLDYDGTLAPFRENRHEAVPAPGVRQRLNRLLEEETTRLVIVSGRPVSDVLKLSRPSRPLEVWGCHGREHLAPGEDAPRVIGVEPRQQEALKRVQEEARNILPAEKIEVKTGCVAFHWRGLNPQSQGRIEKNLRRLCHNTAQDLDMEVRPFDGGLELAVPGRSKGDVVKAVLGEVEHLGSCAVAFLGDDLTDEDGFRALGDRGLSVLVRNQPRQTAAHLRVDMPQGVLDFLDRWIAAVHDASRKESTS